MNTKKKEKKNALKREHTTKKTIILKCQHNFKKKPPPLTQPHLMLSAFTVVALIPSPHPPPIIPTCTTPVDEAATTSRSTAA